MAFTANRISQLRLPLPVVFLILVVHGVPLFLNWYWQLLNYSTMLGYAMLVSPTLTVGLADWMIPPPKDFAPTENITERSA